MPSQGAAAAPHGHGERRRSSGRPAPRLSGAGSPSPHGRFRSSRPAAGAAQRGGAGPGAASATRGSAQQGENTDWWSRGGGRAHGGRRAGPWRCGPGQREAYARPLDWSGSWVSAPRGLLPPAAAGESPATNTHLSPRPRIAGTPRAEPTTGAPAGRSPGATPGRVQPPSLKSAAPKVPRVGKASALRSCLEKGAGPGSVLSSPRCLRFHWQAGKFWIGLAFCLVFVQS